MNFLLSSYHQPYFQMNNSLKKSNDITNNTQTTELLMSSLIDNKVFTIFQNEELFNLQSKRIVINVRGIRFDVIPSLFNKYPTSRLGRLNNFIQCNSNTLKQQDLFKICDDFDLKTNAIQVFESTSSTLNDSAFKAYYVLINTNDPNLQMGVDTTLYRRLTPSAFYERLVKPTIVMNASFFEFKKSILTEGLTSYLKVITKSYFTLFSIE